jgi:hypothetical protein
VQAALAATGRDRAWTVAPRRTQLAEAAA